VDPGQRCIGSPLEKLVAQFFDLRIERTPICITFSPWAGIGFNPWPDSVSGLTRLKTKLRPIGPAFERQCRAWLTQHGEIRSVYPVGSGCCRRKLFEHYKPDPRKPISAPPRLLGLPPEQVMMVRRAQPTTSRPPRNWAWKTAFVAPGPGRITGPLQKYDFRGQGRFGISWQKDFLTG